MVSVESLFSEEIDFIQNVFDFSREYITKNILEELERELEAYKNDNADFHPNIVDYHLMELILPKVKLEEYEVKEIIETVEEATATEREYLY